MLRSLDFSQAQNFSIGFRPGEYGGKKSTSQSAVLASSYNLLFLWNAALSSMIMEYFGIDFKSDVRTNTRKGHCLSNRYISLELQFFRSIWQPQYLYACIFFHRFH
jgi:hypothetical protein